MLRLELTLEDIFDVLSTQLNWIYYDTLKFLRAIRRVLLKNISTLQSNEGQLFFVVFFNTYNTFLIRSIALIRF
jgi:hypothetical protein